MTKVSSPKEVRGIALLFSAAYMVSYIARINFGAVISEMEKATGFSKSLLSMAVTGSFFTYGVGQLVSGILGDKVSPKKLVSCGFIITILMNLLIPVCQDHIQMLAVWSVNGFAQSMMWPPIVKLMASLLSSEDYKKSMTKVSWGSSVGTILVYALSPLLITMLGWKSVFYFGAICGLLILLVWHKCSPDVGISPRAAVEKTTKARMFSPALLGVLGAILMMGILKDSVTTWMPSYVAETYGISNLISILTGVVLPIFAIFSVQAATVLYSKRFKNPVPCAAVFFGLGVLSAGVLWISTGKSAAVSVGCAATLTACMHGVNMMLISMLPPFFAKYGKVSTASGILNAGTYAGSAFSTYAVALFADKWGWGFNLKFWFGTALAGMILCVLSAGGVRKKYIEQENIQPDP